VVVVGVVVYGGWGGLGRVGGGGGLKLYRTEELATP